MAHSSGGGSHGGGCHSGSHSSSGGHSRSYTRSHRRFIGSHRYRYYDRHGNVNYIYCNYDPTKRRRIPWGIVFFYIPFFVAAFSLFVEALFIPKKIENPFSQIVIEDGLNVIKNEDKLRRDLTRFYEETGVTPAVKTITDDDSYYGYSSLMEYAMDEYYRQFDDEKHWLIVYSAPEAYAGNVHGDINYASWKFEGIIGDDTAPSIGDELCEVFTHQTYRHLSTMSDPGEAIGKSFREILDKRSTPFGSIHAADLVTSVLLLAFVLFHMLFMIGAIGGDRKYRNAVLDDGDLESPELTPDQHYGSR